MNFDMTGIGGMLQALEKLNFAMNVQGKGFSIGTNVPYSTFQEFGTSYQSGKAHLRPGFDAVVAMHIDRIIANNDNAEEIVTKIALEIEHQTKIRAPVDTGNLKNSYRAERF